MRQHVPVLTACAANTRSMTTRGLYALLLRHGMVIRSCTQRQRAPFGSNEIYAVQCAGVRVARGHEERNSRRLNGRTTINTKSERVGAETYGDTTSCSPEWVEMRWHLTTVSGVHVFSQVPVSWGRCTCVSPPAPQGWYRCGTVCHCQHVIRSTRTQVSLGHQI